MPSMELIPIKVESHSGYKADEFPEYFYWNTTKYEIDEIADRWYQVESSAAELPAADYFKTITTSGKPFIIKHDLDQDEWFLCR
jgi:hypothetical protein